MNGVSVIYTSGPMTGISNYNKPAFRAATQMLRDRGYEVECPSEVEDGGVQQDWAWYMRHCLVKLSRADAIVVLPGWDRSRGASLEVFIGTQLGLPIYTLAEMAEVAEV